MSKPLASIILAAGQGTRMQSDKQKVLHEVLGKPMLSHVLDTVHACGAHRVVVVVGHQSDEVAKLCHDDITAIEQPTRRGTAHAVMITRASMQDFSGTILILYGDTPLLRVETIQALIDTHVRQQAVCTFLTTRVAEPCGYGRIVRDAAGMVTGIVEEKQATEAERLIDEINVGVYCVESDELFTALDKVKPQASNGEYYLTDIIGIVLAEGKVVAAYETPDVSETLGVNSQDDLKRAETILTHRRRLS